jgi:acetyltransferase-like isoleucine patch superfamily enzyme
VIKKIIWGVIGFFIKLVARFNHKLYMKLYILYLKSRGMRIQGKPIYIGHSTHFDGTDYSLFHIGNNVVISSDCRFLTHDFSISRAVVASGYTYSQEFPIIRPIFIGDNSFIGARSILLPGTKIGKNVIVGAGSVVRGNIPDNSIVIGNPAKVVGNVQDWFDKTMKKHPEYKKYLIKQTDDIKL